ncbi:MAG: YfiT family bacillithiol transferase [Candidatus Binatia bacterium]
MSTEATAQDLSYPIGKFNKTSIDPARRAEYIDTIKGLPAKISAAVDGLDETQIDTPYRPEGWTVRQTAHHIADSHMNAFIRFKLALTEDTPPTIKPYYEDRWAELGDSKLPVDVSLKLIETLHSRWAALLDSMSDADFNRTFIHPETGEWTLDGVLALYAWHGKHHTTHITRLRERNGW